MTNILVTTPNYLLRYDTAAERTWVIENDRTQYYGMSWPPGGSTLYFGHSGIEYEDINTFSEYADSEVGYISAGESKSGPILSAPHQILCLSDNMVAAANTGRNCVNIFETNNWFTRQIRFGEQMWDRYDPHDESGYHINSLFCKNETLFVLAHNFKKGALVWELDIPSFDVVNETRFTSTGLHNLWPRDDGLLISCNSLQAGLVDLRTEGVIWTSDDCSSYTRGLAATSDTIFVGVAMRGTRAERVQGETGIWMLDAGTFQTREYRSLGQWGSVQDIRIIDEFDLCHPNGPLAITPALQGRSPEQMWTEKRRREISAAAHIRRSWNILAGDGLASGPEDFEASGDGLSLALCPGLSAQNVRIDATLDVSRRQDDNIALVVRHQGPGDDNMIAVMLQRNSSTKASLSVWANVAGVWDAPVTRPVASPRLQVGLEVVDSTLRVSADGVEVITMTDLPAPLAHAGAVGIRGVRGRAENIRVNAM